MMKLKSWIKRLKYGFDIDARATERRNQCDICKYNQYNVNLNQCICSRCNQDIDSLVNNPKQNLCPVGFWNDIDEEYIN